MDSYLIVVLAIVGTLGFSSCGVSQRGQLIGGSSSSAGSAADVAFAAQQVDVDFVSAWSRYERGDKAGAGRYLDKASATLTQQGGDAGAIRSLASRVKSGSSVSESEFERTFAGSHRAMAGVRGAEAEQFLAQQQGAAAGSSIEAIAYHTQRSADWSGQTLSLGQQQGVSNLTQIGTALRAGSGYLVKGSGYVVQGTGWVFGKGFNMLTRGGSATPGTAGTLIRGTGQGGETGSGWIEGAGSGIRRFGDWMIGQ